jgi:hypothetical protein
MIYLEFDNEYWQVLFDRYRGDAGDDSMLHIRQLLVNMGIFDDDIIMHIGLVGYYHCQLTTEESFIMTKLILLSTDEMQVANY